MATEFEMTVLTSLGDIKANQEKHFGELKAEQTRITALVDSLAGTDGRVTKLESAANRQFWYTVAVVPLIGAIHAFARKFGVDV